MMMGSDGSLTWPSTSLNREERIAGIDYLAINKTKFLVLLFAVEKPDGYNATASSQ